MPFPAIEITALQAVLSQHLPMYRTRPPYYQREMLVSLAEIWQGEPRWLLDIGGGTGVIAEAIARFFPVERVQTIDMVDRFCPSLSVDSQVYNGKTIPFPDGSFDAASMNNVMHHVPTEARVDLMREIRRVVAGPLYIKDHLSTGWLDSIRLTILDAIGNIPFGGMIWARYLSQAEWESVAAQSGWRLVEQANPRTYRRGLMARLFPNELEITYRFEQA